MNNNGIKISIVMSVYNEPILWLNESIDSILNQTFTDFEFIIINDKPDRAENLSLLKQYSTKDRRIKIIYNDRNIGLTKSLNKGLQAAQGKYIVRMDADDISEHNRLLLQYRFMEDHPECIASGGGVRTFSNDEKIKVINFKLPSTDSEVRQFLLIENAIAHPTAIIKRDVLEKNNLRYNESIKYAQDYAFWCQLIKYGQLMNLPETLLNYRISSNQISSAKRSQQVETANSIRKEYLYYFIDSQNIKIDFSKNDISRQLNKIGLSKGLQMQILKSYYLTLGISFKKCIFLILAQGDIGLLKNYSFIKRLMHVSAKK